MLIPPPSQPGDLFTCLWNLLVMIVESPEQLQTPWFPGERRKTHKVQTGASPILFHFQLRCCVVKSAINDLWGCIQRLWFCGAFTSDWRAQPQTLHLGWYFSLSVIVRCDTGAEINQTAIDGLWRGAAFSSLHRARFCSCFHLCWCQPPQQGDHQSSWCHCYLTVHIVTSEVKWESYCASLLKKKQQQQRQKPALKCEMKIKPG